jgi:hypothetical protein
VGWYKNSNYRIIKIGTSLLGQSDLKEDLPFVKLARPLL